jgi:hypothetical protein
MHWQNGYGHFVLIGSVVSLLGTFVRHSWVGEAPLSAQRAALPFAQLARTMPLGSPTESVKAILALSAPHPANTVVGDRFAYLIDAAQLPATKFTWLFVGAFLCNTTKVGTPTGVWHVELLTDINDGAGRVFIPVTSTNSMAIDADFATDQHVFRWFTGGSGVPENAYYRYDPAIDVQGIEWSIVCDQAPTAGAFTLQAALSGTVFG